MTINGNSCSNKSIIVNIWWRIIRKNSVFDVQKAEKHTHTPTTVAKRDGNSHITLEIKHLRHPSEGNVSLPPPASSSVKTTRTTNQYPKTREWFEPNNIETHASPPLLQEKANPSSKSGKDTLALRATVLQFGLATTASGKSRNLSTKSGKDTRPLQRYSVTVHFYPLHTPTL